MTIPDEKVLPRGGYPAPSILPPDLWMFPQSAAEESSSSSPGQYATLGVETAGEGASSVHIPSCRHRPKTKIEFFFELVPEGALTPLLHKLQPGDHLLMAQGAQGNALRSTRRNGKETTIS